MKVSTISSLGLGTLLLGLVQTRAMSLNIDLFNEPPSGQLIEIDGSKPRNYFVSDTVNGLNTENTLGGRRYIQLELIDRPTEDDNYKRTFLKVDPDPNTNTSNISLSTDDALKSRATIIWGNDSDPELVLGDLTDGGKDNSFKLKVKSIDQPVELNFLVKDTSGNEGTISKSLSSSNNTSYFFPYSYVSNSDVKFESIKSVKLYTSNEPESLDFSFNSIQTAQGVPFEFSPGLGIILSSGLFGFHALKKRWKNNSSDKFIS